MKAFVSLVFFALLLVAMILIIPAHGDSITNGQMQLAEKAKNVVADIFGAEMTYHSAHGYNVYGTFSDLQNQRLINPGYTPTNIATGYEVNIMMSEFMEDGDRPIVMALPVAPDTEQLVGFVAYRNEFSKSFSNGNGVVLNTLAYLLPLDLINDQDKDELVLPFQEIIDQVEAGGTLTRSDRDVILYESGNDILLFYSIQGTSAVYFRGIMYLVMPLQDVETIATLPIYDKAELAQWLMDQTAQSRAKGTLRSFGSCQLAYIGGNDEKVYGYFADLQEELYIRSDYTPETIVDRYVFHFFLAGSKQHFLIVAGGGVELPSFAITDDQVLLKLNLVTGDPNALLDSIDLDMNVFEEYITSDNDTTEDYYDWAYVYKPNDYNTHTAPYYIFFSGQLCTGTPVI